MIPKQPAEGIISINIQPERILSIGDTDISGTIEFPGKFNVYVSVLILIEVGNKTFYLDTETDFSTGLWSSCWWNKNTDSKFIF